MPGEAGMQVTANVGELRSKIAGLRRNGRRIGFVPTMGNLHAGHYSLIAQAREHCDFVVASIFVNPTQFGAGEDFSRYPRTPEDDTAGLGQHGCDLVFLPGVDAIYPLGLEQGVRVSVPNLGDILDGASRPGHFDGVATVVTRLFNLVQPDLAVFGSKDFQQLQVIRRLTRDLGFPIEILAAPIVREVNGLAMSSRNQYLSAEQREQAAIIYATLRWMCSRLREGEGERVEIEGQARAELDKAGLVPVYSEFRVAQDLDVPAPGRREGLVALIAARLGTVRLIDNLECRD
jgi:pantoate--beta-alanine ligase